MSKNNSFNNTFQSKARSKTGQKPTVPRDTLIKNITIIDPTYNEPLKDVAIFIKNKKIVDIGKATCVDIDDGTKVIDGKDMFILPGVIDMHVQLMANGFIQ
jgi:imidazolonepropionase-like amidohydrolase